MDVCTRIDSTLKRLSYSRCCYKVYEGGHARILNRRHELRFLKMFFWCYANWEYAGKKYGHLGRFVSEMETADDSEDLEGEHFYHPWLNKADLLIPEIKDISLDFIHSSSISCKSSTSAEIHQFLFTVQENLEDLLGSNAQMFVTVKEQIEVLQQKLKFFRDLVKFTALRCVSNEQELKDFGVQVQDWANRVACLLFLYWVDQNEGETVPNLKTELLHVLETKPCTSVVKRVFLLALKASKSLQPETFLMGNLVANSMDLILEDMMASTEDSVKTSIHDGLIILITFLMDPPPMECGNEILAKVKDVVDHIFFCVPEEEEGIPSDRYILVNDFLEKIDILKAEIRKNYVQSPDLSLLNFPRTNGLGFIDFLLGNLKERASSIIFAKSLILVTEEKLLSVRDYLKDLVEQQNEIEELKHLWTQIINGAYVVEHVVDSFFFGDEPIWHNMIRLSILQDEFEFIMTEVKKIRDEFMNNFRVHIGDELMCDRSEEDSVCTIPKHGQTSRIDELIVGFKNEATQIIDQLTRGSRELKVVSIVGMAGQGKTTLVDEVYNDGAVKYHFHIRAWCFVSQVYQQRELLLNILNDVAVKDEMGSESEEDLAKKLYQCLKGRRYLIVMDDIWKIEAWDKLKESFPNDNTGSRIMFTSRIQSIVLQVKLGSSTHLLYPLSVDESWELLQRKLFHEACCPPYLSEVGMKIVKNCQGLPLSIVAIAGVLARRVTHLDWWKEIEDNLNSKILGEGNSMDILELSYNHLPDYLKPCFLYFGAFRQGKPVNVRMLTQLWVAKDLYQKLGWKGQRMWHRTS